jgi:hypothetical protein
MAALTVFLSASPADADFAERLSRAIRANGGKVVSSPPSSSSPPAGASPGDAAPLPQGELKSLEGARAYVAVLSPAALASGRLRSEADRYSATARRDAKRKVVPVQLEPLPPDASVPALRSYPPVTGPYGTPELQDKLIAETLSRLGLPVQGINALVLLIAALLALLLLACLGSQVLAPGGGLHFVLGSLGGSQPTATLTATATPTATPLPAGTGLLGQYYRSRRIDCCVAMPDDLFGALLFTKVDPQINIHSGNGQYPDPRLAGGAYAIRWTGQIRPQYSETYTFTTQSDDGVRVWVNGQVIIDDWKTHAEATDTGSIALKAGQLYDIRIDYYENDVSGAVMVLQWQSASQPFGLVPASALYPARQ